MGSSRRGQSRGTITQTNQRRVVNPGINANVGNQIQGQGGVANGVANECERPKLTRTEPAGKTRGVGEGVRWCGECRVGGSPNAGSAAAQTVEGRSATTAKAEPAHNVQNATQTRTWGTRCGGGGWGGVGGGMPVAPGQFVGVQQQVRGRMPYKKEKGQKKQRYAVATRYVKPGRGMEQQLRHRPATRCGVFGRTGVPLCSAGAWGIYECQRQRRVSVACVNANRTMHVNVKWVQIRNVAQTT